MNHDSEKEFLDRSLGPAFYPMLERHRQRQTDSIHAWLRDAVYTTLLDPHQSGCDCPLHDLDDVRPYSLAAALTMTVRDLVNEAAATGVDVLGLMRRHTPTALGRLALDHRLFMLYLHDVTLLTDRSLGPMRESELHLRGPQQVGTLL
jgi:hypothetical protein